MTTQTEKKNRNVGITVAVVLHAILLLCFLGMMAWMPPDPPLPETGIEINFGTDDAGDGQQQPESVSEQNEPEEANESDTPNEDVEEPITEPEVTPEPVLEEAPAEVTPETVVTTDTEAPVKVEEQKEEVKEVPKKEAPKKETPKKQDPTPEPKKEPVKETPKPKANKNTVLGSKKSGGSNQGNKTGEVGDQGDPEGDINSDALVGKRGGGADGASMKVDGWYWDKRPKPNDATNESGKIVFSVKIDENGEILSCVKIESTVSPSTVKVYRDEVLKTTFHRTNGASNVASISKGTITFVIKSK